MEAPILRICLFAESL